MKICLAIGFFCCVLFACQNDRRASIISDSGTYWDPNSPICDPDNLARLQTDFLNCGACGNYCNAGYADRCSMGTCLCGQGPECAPGTGCRFGSCVTADRFSPCISDAECATGQACISSGDEKYCINVCEFDDACPAGFACIEGACTFVTCVPEECDGFDNDCDGRVDESAEGTPLSKFCYSVPDTDPWQIIEPCMPGVQICLPVGQWSECIGEVPPTAEQGTLACDLIDNNCDGCIDGVMLESGLCQEAASVNIDVIFAVDTSGSMDDEIDAVVLAMQNFSTYFSTRTDVRFAIALVPGGPDAQAIVFLELSTYADFIASLMTIPINVGASEPSYDVVFELGTGEIELNWLEGSTRVIVLFTDEAGQTYRRYRAVGSDVTESDMCSALTHGEVFAAVVPTHHQDNFDECAILFPLTNDAEEMANQLITIIRNPCE